MNRIATECGHKSASYGGGGLTNPVNIIIYNLMKRDANACSYLQRAIFAHKNSFKRIQNFLISPVRERGHCST